MIEGLSVVLPCFNEEANIERTVRDVAAWMDDRGLQGEIIVVNDGSTDGTGEILEKMKREWPVCHTEPVEVRHADGQHVTSCVLRQAQDDTLPHTLRVITHPRNLGYGAAVRDGCDAATTEWIGFMDSDGQFDPKDFDRLLPFVCHPEPVEGSTHKQYDVVVGRRRKRADPLLRKLNAKLFGFLSWLVLGIWVRDMNCAMKIFRRSAWQRARPVVTTGALFNAEFFYNLKRQGISWKQVDVAHYPRRFGQQTGANLGVIGRMFRELWILRRQGKMSCVQRKGEL